MSMKQAAEELLKIADEIEKEASEVTSFVCDSCNHTATLASINEKRKMAADEAAREANKEVVIGEITVNDKVHCPACEGTMSYHPTEASEQYYIDEKAAGDDEDDDDDDKKSASLEPIDYDSLQRYMG
jgi:C4-type Zn-finger protein